VSVANAPEHPATPQGSLLARHPLTSFFLLAYAFTWLAWSPWFLSEDGVGLLPGETGHLRSVLSTRGVPFRAEPDR
jgi:hypothetical protein